MLHQKKALSFKKIVTLVGSVAILSTTGHTFAASNPLSITTSEPKPVVSGNRSLFMNGVDISSARNQDLRNVHIRISENGDIFITAPQYQVTEEETFTPLSSYTAGQGRPAHQQQATEMTTTGGEVKAASSDGEGQAIGQTAPAAKATKSSSAPQAKADPLPEKPATLLKQ